MIWFALLGLLISAVIVSIYIFYRHTKKQIADLKRRLEEYDLLLQVRTEIIKQKNMVIKELKEIRCPMEKKKEKKNETKAR